MTQQKRPRKDKKFRHNREELREKIYEALLWASNGIEFHMPGEKKPKPLVFGDPENLTVILVEALTVGLPEEDSATPAGDTV